jgi:hypothetical protein
MLDGSIQTRDNSNKSDTNNNIKLERNNSKAWTPHTSTPKGRWLKQMFQNDYKLLSH